MKPLYPGCTAFTRLSAVLVLVNLKARFGWSDKSFTELLVLLKKLLPEDSTLSKNQYEAKKIYAQWEWSTKKSMHVHMIAYCTEISLQKCASALHVVYHNTRSTMANVVMMQP